MINHNIIKKVIRCPQIAYKRNKKMAEKYCIALCVPHPRQNIYPRQIVKNENINLFQRLKGIKEKCSRIKCSSENQIGICKTCSSLGSVELKTPKETLETPGKNGSTCMPVCGDPGALVNFAEWFGNDLVAFEQEVEDAEALFAALESVY